MQVRYLTTALLLGASTALPLSDDASHRPIARSHIRTLHARDQAGVLNELLNTKPTTTAPQNEVELRLRLSSIWGSTNGSSIDFYAGVKSQIAADLGLPDGISTADPIAPNSALGSPNNSNPKEPASPVYPQKSEADAPYSIPEAQLRAAIQIPQYFTYGARPPVILIPGTGSYGGEVYAPNIMKVLPGAPFADPVWLNVPDALLGDVQANAEYVAYAINYISGISSGKNVSLISWSQGGLDVQWSFTFWPSTRERVSDFIAVSPDFHGTVLAQALCLDAGPETPGVNPCPASVIQQEYNSRFISTLRAKGGADAYVPTTTLYSGFYDEIVEPQQGVLASAFLGDARGVGVTNVDAQPTCLGRVGAGFYGHAGMLFHPLTVALVIDALSHDGPGDLGRLDLEKVCSRYIAPGLSVENAIDTSGLIVTAAIRLLTYFPRDTVEPPLRAYAM